MRLINLFRKIIAQDAGDGRERLPDRRQQIVADVKFTDARLVEHVYRVGFGLGPDNTIREVFCSDGKSGSDRQSLMHDGCILMSLALQHGMSITDLAHSMSELSEEDSSGRRPASPFGAIAHAGEALEAELRGYAND